MQIIPEGSVLAPICQPKKEVATKRVCTRSLMTRWPLKHSVKNPETNHAEIAANDTVSTCRFLTHRGTGVNVSLSELCWTFPFRAFFFPSGILSFENILREISHSNVCQLFKYYYYYYYYYYAAFNAPCVGHKNDAGARRIA